MDRSLDELLSVFVHQNGELIQMVRRRAECVPTGKNGQIESAITFGRESRPISLADDGVAWIAVGVEGSYPQVTSYDYHQLILAFLLTLAASRDSRGRRFRLLLVLDDSLEANRYNINPAAESIRRTGRSHLMLADLERDDADMEWLATAGPQCSDGYCTSDDLRAMTHVFSAHARYLDAVWECKRRILEMALGAYYCEFESVAARVNMPVEHVRRSNPPALGGLLADVFECRPASEGRVIGPLAEYYRATREEEDGGVLTLRKTRRLARTPFTPVCPNCGCGSARVLQVGARVKQGRLAVVCRPKAVRLCPRLDDGSADVISGCGFRFSVGVGEPMVLGNRAVEWHASLPIWGMFLPVSAWVNEHPSICNHHLWTSLGRVTAAYRAGLLGRVIAPPTQATLVLSCRRRSCFRATGGGADRSVLFERPKDFVPDGDGLGLEVTNVGV